MKTKIPLVSAVLGRFLPSTLRKAKIQTDEEALRALASIEDNNPQLIALTGILHERFIYWADEAADMGKPDSYRLRANDRMMENKQVIDVIEMERARAKEYHAKLEEQRQEQAKRAKG